MHTRWTLRPLLNALRPVLHSSRWWPGLAAATVAAYLTAAAAPTAPARPAGADTAGRGPLLSCGPAGFIIQCYSPGQYQVAYGVTPLLNSGITGSGETVVMPELANTPGPDFRGVPDVAADADSSTAMALTFTGGVLVPAQGTSASTPLWAAVMALTDQEAGQHLGFVNPAIYRIAHSRAYHSAFHDVVTGDNSVLWPTGVFMGYEAGPGWDPVTGWGSPDAQSLVPLLAHQGPITGR